MVGTNVTNNVTNKNLREEPKQLATVMMSPNVTNNVTDKKQLGGMVGTNTTNMMGSNVTNNVTNKTSVNQQLSGMVRPTSPR